VEEVEEERPPTPWGVGNSIFRSFRIDTEDLLRKCFEFDYA
jgi:hypothetical protein